MKKIITLITIPLISMLAMPAMAGHGHDNYSRYDRFDKRMDRQAWRIKKGIRSGELTPYEARKLRKQQRRIARMKYRYMSDGYLSHWERKKLNRTLNKASSRIYEFKHNNRYRYRTQSYPTYRHDVKRKHHDGRWSVHLSYRDYL